MLSSLTLNNVALIKKETVEFEKGFNCLLGQSGAGKSILIDAISFVLGARADKTLIRSGQQNMRVDAVFVDVSDDVLQILKEQEIDVDDEVVFSRTLNLDGKSSIRINGCPVVLKTLQTISSCLIDFCGQHDGVGLLNVNNHLSILDKYVGQQADELKSKIASLCQKIKEYDEKIASLGGNASERERTKEILNYQIQEIEDAHLSVGEEEELREKYNFATSAEKIFQKVGDALTKIDEQRECASTLLYSAKSDLSSFSQFKEIEECRERLENAYYEVKDVSSVLEKIKNNTEFDEKEFERIDARLDLIKKLSKKYGSDISTILSFCEKCKKQLDELENGEFLIDKMTKEKETTEKELLDLCEKLSLVRKEFAKTLEKKVVEQLSDLEMKGTSFNISFEKTDCGKNGNDIVKFMFSANVGQDVKDLHKTASGGELSRLMLAFKNVFLDKEKVQTVVFDEIDAGISGRTAGKVAEKIANISKYIQVLCITHTPVVATKANSFLLVEKKVVENETVSQARKLLGDEKLVEVAKLIDGGESVSTTAIDHVKKMFEEY